MSLRNAYGEPTQVGSGFGDGFYGSGDADGRGAGFGIHIGFIDGAGGQMGNQYNKDIVTDLLIVEAVQCLR